MSYGLDSCLPGLTRARDKVGEASQLDGVEVALLQVGGGSATTLAPGGS
jgi:hypothetical protein